MIDEQVYILTQSDTALMLTRLPNLLGGVGIFPLMYNEIALTPSNMIRRSSLHCPPHSTHRPTTFVCPYNNHFFLPA